MTFNQSDISVNLSFPQTQSYLSCPAVSHSWSFIRNPFTDLQMNREGNL